MGIMLKGKWHNNELAACDDTGHFIRADSIFRDWVTQDGSSGFLAEANRYHLYVSYACPWACRTLIMLAIKDLQKIISVSVVDALMGEQGWSFGPPGEATQDQINHASFLHEIYSKANPQYTGRVTVPVLWDKKNNTIVNNESAEIIRMLNSEFNHITNNHDDHYPENLRKEIDVINDYVYDKINNGVYKCGFATTQTAYEEAFDELFMALDEIEKRLSQQRYLVGDVVTEADWRLFTTLIRFDVVYVGHFKCNLRRIEDYPNLSNYLHELYQVSGVKQTVNFEHIKNHYYQSHESINPTGIVPKGPEIDYDKGHNRALL